MHINTGNQNITVNNSYFNDSVSHNFYGGNFILSINNTITIMNTIFNNSYSLIGGSFLYSDTNNIIYLNSI